MAEDSVARGHGFLSQWARAEARFPPFDPGQLQLVGHAQTLPARPRRKMGAELVSAPQAPIAGDSGSTQEFYDRTLTTEGASWCWAGQQMDK